MPQNIEEYLDKEDIEYKKILVVADSLWKVFAALEKKNIPYNDYHIMIDEVDKFMRDSDFRESLSNAMDYYFEFPPRNRTLVTATVTDFSDPKINSEPKTVFRFNKSYLPQRTISVYPTNNIRQALKRLILKLSAKHKNDKIFIAFNSVEIPTDIIAELNQDKSLTDKFALACSESRSKEVAVEDYHVSLNDLDEGKLPRRICFTTSTNFVGIDIEDDYHLIFVGNYYPHHHMMKPSDLIQIYGRNRKKDGVLSEHFIFTSRDLRATFTDNDMDDSEEGMDNEQPVVLNNIQAIIGELSAKSKEDFERLDIEIDKEPYKEFAEEVVISANNILALKNDFIKRDEGNKTKALPKHHNKKYLKTRIHHFNKFIDERRVFIKFNAITDELIPDYFNIDSHTETEFYETKVYNTANNVMRMMLVGDIFNDITINTTYFDIEQDPEESKKIREEKRLAELELCFKAIEDIDRYAIKEKEIRDGGMKIATPDNFLNYYMKRNYDENTNSYLKTLIERINDLFFLLEVRPAIAFIKDFYEEIIDKKTAARQESTQYHKFYNSILYTALSSSDTLKSYMINNLRVGSRYPLKDSANNQEGTKSIHSIVESAFSSVGYTHTGKTTQPYTEFLKSVIEYKVYNVNNPNEEWEIISHNKLKIPSESIKPDITINNIERSIERLNEDSTRHNQEPIIAFKGSGFISR